MIKDFIRTVRVRAVRALASTRPRLDVSERRVLVVAPHPDDEVFGCAGLVQQLVQSGTQVDVVIVTGGQKPRRLLWPRRGHAHPSAPRTGLLGRADHRPA